MGDLTHEVDIVVPVLDRPHRAAPFVDSLARSVQIRRVAVLAVVSAADPVSAEAWERAGADVLVCYEPGTYSRKVNLAYRELERLGSPAPWTLYLGDDVRFHAGWLDHALAVAHSTGAAVVATNDWGLEPDAQSCVHPLISRAYVRDAGASWDGPGVVAHEGYRHYYVDAEWCALARWRGAWAAAPDAVIEHLHHLFRKAPVDRVYELATSYLAADRALFEERYHRWVEIRGAQPVA